MQELTESVLSIFPTPIYTSFLKRNLLNDEKQFITQQKNFIINKTNSEFNITNSASLNKNVLNENIFINLKKFILDETNNFLLNVLQFVDIEPYITQSWLNYTEQNEYHLSHNHPNSFYSGVLYLQTNNDQIVFENSRYDALVPNVKQGNIFNVKYFTLNVKDNQLIIFPSFLKHQVNFKSTKDTRISLAFNIWIKGKLGQKHSLSELYV